MKTLTMMDTQIINIDRHRNRKKYGKVHSSNVENRQNVIEETKRDNGWYNSKSDHKCLSCCYFEKKDFYFILAKPDFYQSRFKSLFLCAKPKQNFLLQAFHSE
jgi:protein required for attachment to host cells